MSQIIELGCKVELQFMEIDVFNPNEPKPGKEILPNEPITVVGEVIGTTIGFSVISYIDPTTNQNTISKLQNQYLKRL